jgi:hypothetical protein
MRVLAWLTLISSIIYFAVNLSVFIGEVNQGENPEDLIIQILLFIITPGIAAAFAALYFLTTRTKRSDSSEEDVKDLIDSLLDSKESESEQMPVFQGESDGKTDVRKKSKSIFRFLGLAAFILGPSWFLFMASTGRSWFVGVLIGLPLALIGYITIRLVDVEDERKGAVIRAVRLAYCELRTWPLWAQHGLLSFALTVTMFYCGEIAGQFLPILNFLTAGAIAPLFLLNLLPPINFNPGIPMLIVVALVVPSAIWFLFGVLLGRVNECIGGKLWVYIIVWFAVYTILSEAMVLPPSFYDKLLDYFAVLDSQWSGDFIV